jgi:hypothetical protein
MATRCATLLGVSQDEPFRIGDLEFASDLSPARWLVERIHGFARNVGSVLPEGFEAYARVFHPATRYLWDDSVPEGGPPDRAAAAAAGLRPRGRVAVRWSEVAAANGTVMHAEAQFEAISQLGRLSTACQPGIWDIPPMVGALPEDAAGRLVEILSGYTSTPSRCWFCVWEGYGGLRTPAGFEKRVLLPGRAYLLVAGPITAVQGAFENIDAEGPSIWWPDDGAWCVATEIDFCWTYVGGRRSCVEAVLADQQLEALPARIDHGITIESDRINALPDVM